MQTFVSFFDHPVYQSVYQTLGYAAGIGPVKAVGPGSLRVLYTGKTFNVQHLNARFSSNTLHVMNSPIICLDAWRALLHRAPAIFVEEYFEESRLRDALVASLLSAFRSYPFISFTKRTHSFLMRSRLNSFLVPAAEKRRGGSKTREGLLYVGRMAENKRPDFALDLAEKLPQERFTLVGRGPLLPVIRKRASRLSNVEVIEFVETREELFRDYYGKVKALIHPADRDPVGFVIVEALSTQTPVISSVGVGASDFLPKPWRVATHDLNDWAQTIGGISDQDLKVAENTFEQENLNIESPYFRRTAERLSSFLRERGWTP
jgi:glycosyltransferase involved in cell wall biosynthesis